MAQQSTMKRVLRGVGKGLMWLGLGLVMIVGLAVAFINVGPGREFVRARANAALAPLFVGRVVVDRLGRIGLTSISGIDARVLDARGKVVIKAYGLRAAASWPGIVWDAVRGRALTIRIEPVRGDHVEVTLIDDGQGSPTLAGAFAPREPAPAPEPNEPPSTTTLLIPALEVKHIWAHGALSSLAVDAELRQLTVSLASRPEHLELEVAKGTLVTRALPLRADPSGALTAKARIPSAPGGKPRVIAKFVGHVADARTTLAAELDGERVRATLDMPEVPAEALNARVPSLTLQGPSAVEAEVSGTTKNLELDLTATSPALRLAVRGQVTSAEDTRIKAELAFSDVNARAAQATAPVTRLAGRVVADATLRSSGAIEADFRVNVQPGRVNELVTPAISSHGTLAKARTSALRVDGQLVIEDPGLTAHLDYRFRDSPDTGQVGETKLRAVFTNPARMKAMLGASLSGSLGADATVDLTRKSIDAELRLDARDVAVEQAQLAKVTANARVEGNLDAPRVRAQLVANDVRALERRFRTVRANGEGSLARLDADVVLEESEDASIRARATVSATDGLRLLDPSLVLRRNGDTVVIRATRVSALPSATRVEGIALDGAGSLRGNVALERGRVKADVLFENLALERLARTVGVQLPLRKGTVSGTARLSGPPSRLVGEVDIKARDLDFDQVRNGQVNVALEVNDKTISGEVDATLSESKLAVRFDRLDLPTAPYTRERLLAVRGEVTAKGNVDLTEFKRLLAAFEAPIADARGNVDLDLKLSNPRGEDGAPKLEIALETKDLKLVTQRPNREEIPNADVARESQPFALEGIDLKMAAEVDAGKRRGNVDLTVRDEKGAIASLRAETTLPGLASARLADELARQKFRAELDVPSRELDDLPAPARPPGIRGAVAANVVVEGTALEPSVLMKLAVQRFRSRAERRGLDGEINLDFDRTGGKLSGNVRGRSGNVANLGGKWQGNLLARLREPARTDVPIVADADLKLRRFPLGIVPALSDRSVRGPLDADIVLSGLGEKPSLSVKVDGSKLRIGEMRLQKLDVEAEAADGALKAKVDAGAKGSLRAEFATPIEWKRELVPNVDPRAKISVRARKMDISALSPLVLGYVSEIGGKLDAELDAQLTDDAPLLKGQAELSEGTIQIPQIGQRFSDVSLKTRVNEGEIVLESLQASGLSGRLSANGRAKMTGADLTAASGRLEIKEKEKLPVTFEGQAIGDAWGHIDVKYTKREDGAEVRVDVPTFQIQVPDTGFGSVQSLSADEHVKVGVYQPDGRFAAIPIQPIQKAEEGPAEPAAPLRLAVHLGDNVWVERENQAKVQLGGDIAITSGEETKIEGRIELRGGKLDVSGKRFDIERGVISFDGDDPSDPTITATARWDSPLGFAVYAEYSGTAKAGKLDLRSEPPLTQSEVLSLLMFGSPEGSLGSGQGGGAAATAVGVAGDTATRGFNRVMSDFTHLDVSARIDTSTGSARPELVVQVTPRVTTRVTRALGEPSPGQSPDRTFLTLEFRLHRAWGLSAVVGDRGASMLDLVWRKRY